MNDLEHDLRELFQAKSRDVSTDPVVPGAVVRAGHRRQASTVFVSVLAGLAVLTAAIAGLNVVRDHHAVPAVTPPVATRTSTIAAITLTYPTSWSLEDLWMSGSIAGIPGGERPVLFLATPGTNSMGVGGCGTAFAQTSTSVVLYVGAEVGETTPVSTQGAGAVAPDLTGFKPCAGGRYLRWTSGGTPYIAYVGSGPRADPADVRRMRDVVSGFRLASRTPTDVAGPPMMGTVLASGDGGAWSLEYRSSLGSGAQSLVVIEGSTHRVLGDAGDPPLGGGRRLVIADAPADLIHFGYVRSDATKLTLVRPDGTRVGAATLVSLGGMVPRYQAFWREGALPGGGVRWTAVNAQGVTLRG